MRAPTIASATRRAPAGLSALLTAATVLGASGCASNLSGIGGAEQYACRAPVGAQCTSVSGVYANAGQGARQVLQPLDASDRAAVSSERHAATPAAPPGNAPAGDRVASQSATAPAPATTASQPLRSPPRVLRLWIAPWEDSDGDLHEASTVNVLIDHGRWLVERVRPTPRAPRMGVTTPPATSPAPTTPNGTAPAIGPRTSPALTNPNLDQPEP